MKETKDLYERIIVEQSDIYCTYSAKRKAGFGLAFGVRGLDRYIHARSRSI